MLNLNEKALKDFRDTLALYHIADFNKADADVTKNKYVKNLQGSIKTNYERMAKIENGDKTLGDVTIESLQEEIEEFQAKIDKEVKRIKALKAEYDKDIAKGEELVPDVLVNAMIKCAKNAFDADAESQFVSELVNWFKTNGASKVVADDVQRYARIAYSAIRINSSKGKCELDMHNGVEKDKKARQLFLNAICDEPTMRSILPIYKWQNVISKKTRK